MTRRTASRQPDLPRADPPEGGARTRLTQNIRKSEISDAADIATAKGVTVEITAPNGKVYRIAPAAVAVKDDDGLEAWRARKAQRANPRPL